MPRRKFLCLCALLLLVLPTGCLWHKGQWDPMNHGDAFEESRKRFTRLIRWNQFEKASEMVALDHRAAFLSQTAALRGVRFSDYEVVLVDLDGELRTATVDVVFRAYGASMIEKTFAVRQNWARDEKTDRWRVRPELAELSRSFPANATY